MTKIIAVHSIKGGVGKTTLSVNLAGVSALWSKHRTLIWDLDAQGSATFLCGVSGSDPEAMDIFSRSITPKKLIVPSAWPKIDLIGADFSLRSVEQLLLEAGKPKRLRKILREVAPFYDRIILDCPPGLNELSDQVLRAADLVVAPLMPTPLGIRSLTQLNDYIVELGWKEPKLMPVISMLDQRRSMHRDFAARRAAWKAIPQSSIIEQMAIKKAPIQHYAGASKPALIIRSIWQEIEQLLNTQSKQELSKKVRGRPRIPRSPECSD